MTDMTKIFNEATETLRGARAHGFRKGMQAVDFAKEFRKFGIENFGASEMGEK